MRQEAEYFEYKYTCELQYFMQEFKRSNLYHRDEN